MSKLPVIKGLVSWQQASDAIADKNGYLLYLPNRAEKLWRVKALWWRFLAFTGKMANNHSPKVVK